MKIILSRKGFDSPAGRRPSPIFPNCTMMSLPIPDDNSMVRSRCVKDGSHYSGKIVPLRLI